MREIKLLLFSNKKIYFAYFALKHMIVWSIEYKNKNKMHVKKKKMFASAGRRPKRLPSNSNIYQRTYKQNM